MKWESIPSSKLKAAEQKFWTALGDRADFVARSINNDEGYLLRLAAWATKPPFADKMMTSVNPQWLRARQIMGQNFFGLEEAGQHFGLACSKTVGPKGFAQFAEIPFSEDVLAACRATHILAAVFPFSIVDMWAQLKDKSPNLFLHSQQYPNEAFKKHRGEVGWHLVRKTPVEGSTYKSWDDQLGLLGPDEEVPEARVLVYAILGHFLATGERLFKSVYVRRSDRDAEGYNVRVGGFTSTGLYVDDMPGSYKLTQGLASSWKRI